MAGTFDIGTISVGAPTLYGPGVRSVTRHVSVQIISNGLKGTVWMDYAVDLYQPSLAPESVYVDENETETIYFTLEGSTAAASDLIVTGVSGSQMVTKEEPFT